MKRHLPLWLILLASSVGPGWAQEERYELAAAERRQLGDPSGVELAGPELESRAREVGSLLRCPVCQGLSIFDSPVPAAQAMQHKVELLLGAGYSEAQILTYFETSYGEFIRLWPKAEGFNLVVWVLPVLAMLFGAGLIVRRVRSASAMTAGDAEDLEVYRQRVREEIHR